MYTWEGLKGRNGKGKNDITIFYFNFYSKEKSIIWAEFSHFIMSKSPRAFFESPHVVN